MLLENIRKNVNGRIDAYIKEAQTDANNVLDMVAHRVKFGSPPLIQPSEDVEVSSRAALDAKQERIKRRRLLLGLPYEDWKGVGGK